MSDVLINNLSGTGAAKPSRRSSGSVGGATNPARAGGEVVTGSTSSEVPTNGQIDSRSTISVWLLSDEQFSKSVRSMMEQLRDAKASKATIYAVEDFFHEYYKPTGHAARMAYDTLKKDEDQGKDPAGIRKRLLRDAHAAGAGHVSMSDKLEDCYEAMDRLIARSRKRSIWLNPVTSFFIICAEAVALWGLAFQIFHEVLKGMVATGPLAALAVGLVFACIVKVASKFAFVGLRSFGSEHAHRALGGHKGVRIATSAVCVAVLIALIVMVPFADSGFFEHILKMSHQQSMLLAGAMCAMFAVTVTLSGSASSGDHIAKLDAEIMRNSLRMILNRSKLEEAEYAVHQKHERNTRKAWIYMKAREMEMRDLVRDGLSESGRILPSTEKQMVEIVKGLRKYLSYQQEGQVDGNATGEQGRA